jgi:anti-sigma B factor antagonist
VEDAVKKAFDARFPQLVIDLRRVTFVDSSGLRVFIEARQEALKREIELRVSPGPPRVQRIFEVTGLAGWFPAPVSMPDGSVRGPT